MRNWNGGLDEVSLDMPTPPPPSHNYVLLLGISSENECGTLH